MATHSNGISALQLPHQLGLGCATTTVPVAPAEIADIARDIYPRPNKPVCQMGLEPSVPGPKTSRPAAQQRIYP
jgi:hypothetical protein